MAWWAVLGLGLGFMMLSGLVWVRHDSGAGTAVAKAREPAAPVAVVAEAEGQPENPASVEQQSQQPGKASASGVVVDDGASAVAPLMQALADAAAQRRQALIAYQAQIGAAGLGDALTPTSLAGTSGRKGARQSLARLESALDALIRQDNEVQSQLAGAVDEWLRAAPRWGDAARRKALVDAAGSGAATMSEFFKVERDIVAQVEGMLSYFDKIGKSVSVEGTGQQQELVFRKADDLAFYRSTLVQLGQLGQREQALLAQAQQAGATHTKEVSELLASAGTAGP